MNCIEFEDRLHELCDARSPLNSAELAPHAAECAACHELWQEQLLLTGAVAAWRSGLPQVDLSDQILDRWAAESAAGTARPAAAAMARASSPGRSGSPDVSAAPAGQRREVRARSRWKAREAVAILTGGLAAVLLLRLGGPLPPAPAPAPVVATVDSPHEMPDDSALPLHTFVRSAQAAYVQLAEETAGAMRDVVAIVPPPAAAPTGVGIPDLNDDTPRELFRGVGEELKPLGSTVGQALGFLWGAVPGEGVPAT